MTNTEYKIEYDNGEPSINFKGGLTAIRFLYSNDWEFGGFHEEKRMWLFTKGEGDGREHAYMIRYEVDE